MPSAKNLSIMSALNELHENLEQTRTAHFVTTMLRDISATKLRSLREEFEANQAYYLELHMLMGMVKQYAQQTGVELPTPETTKRVYIAFTSNRRFYGALNRSVMERFTTELQTHPTAAGYVIGQTGQTFLEQHAPTLEIPVATFAGDIPSRREAATVIERIATYNEVMVIHPTFINSFQQQAAMTDITHVPNSEAEAPPVLDYICEPELPELLDFFKNQIRLVLLQRVMLETQVALTGARLMKMQRARERADDLITEERQGIHKAENLIRSMRLLETFTGYTSDRHL